MLPFSIIFCYLLLAFHVKTMIRLSLRDKRLFEISEVEITRVYCTFKRDSAVKLCLLSSEKGSVLNGKNLLPLGGRSFILE